MLARLLISSDYETTTAPKPWLVSSVRKRHIEACCYCTGPRVHHVLTLTSIEGAPLERGLFEMGFNAGIVPCCIPVCRNQALGKGTYNGLTLHLT